MLPLDLEARALIGPVRGDLELAGQLWRSEVRPGSMQKPPAGCWRKPVPGGRVLGGGGVAATSNLHGEG